jgi:hypothetical protein
MATKTKKAKQITAHVTVAKFTDTRSNFAILRNKVPLQEFEGRQIGALEYRATGWDTPLRDSVARLIKHGDKIKSKNAVTILLLADESGSMVGREGAVISGINDFVAGMAEVDEVDPEAAGDVIAVILTDGLENASREVSAEALREMLALRENEGWTFIFIGAQIDAWGQSASLGLSGGVTGQSISTPGSAAGVYAAMSSVTTDSADYLTSKADYKQKRVGSTRRSINEDGSETPTNINAAPGSATRPDEPYGSANLGTLDEALRRAKKATRKAE